MVAAQPARSAKVWALADQACQSATNFLTMVLAARYLTVGAFAQFSLAYLAVLFAASFHRTWVTQPMNVLGARTPEELPVRVAALWRAHVVLVPAGVLVVLAVSPLGFLEPWLLLATAAYLALFFLQEMQRRHAYTRFAIRPASALSLVMGAAQLAGLGLLISWGERHAAWWMAVLAGAQLVGVLLGRVLLRVEAEGGERRTAREVLLEQLRHSRWVVASQLVFWGSSQIYPFLVASLGATQTATFNAGMSILNAANVLRMTLANFLPAQASRIRAAQGEAAVCAYARRLLTKLALAGLLAWLVLLFLAEPIVQLLYGDKFPDAAQVLRWLSLGIWASVLSVVLNALALALDSTENIFFSNAVGTGFTLTAGLYLTHRYGLTGAIWSNVVGYTIPALYQFVRLWPRLRSPKN
jgi:O-antigen/teichoic acid export membrane protein